MRYVEGHCFLGFQITGRQWENMRKIFTRGAHTPTTNHRQRRTPSPAKLRTLVLLTTLIAASRYSRRQPQSGRQPAAAPKARRRSRPITIQTLPSACGIRYAVGWGRGLMPHNIAFDNYHYRKPSLLIVCLVFRAYRGRFYHPSVDHLALLLHHVAEYVLQPCYAVADVVCDLL